MITGTPHDGHDPSKWLLWKMTFTAADILTVCEDEIHEDIEMTSDLQIDIEQWMFDNSEIFVQKVMGVFQDIVANKRPPEWSEGRPAGTYVCLSCGAVKTASDMVFIGGEYDKSYCRHPEHQAFDGCAPVPEKDSDFAPRRDL